jgi:radical SAM superfamily enzyme YgiQ (UPF0313 family)
VTAEPVVDQLPDGEASGLPPLGEGVRTLLVWPRFPPSFWGFGGMLSLLPERTIMPPLGLLTIAALCPRGWPLRLIDCSFEDLTDGDLFGAELVMLSAMHAQREEVREIASRARKLGRRTILGGPYASSQPREALQIADHVVAGEPDEVFGEIARALENGTARRLYEIATKPDVTRSPSPRFDLLRMDRYTSMAIQFSRGCPFQCEFCDIITLYGRRPRTKTPPQVLAELDALRRLGWKRMVFIVDDNFVGNHKKALEVSEAIAAWQDQHGRPFALYTEASIDLAQRPVLIRTMAAANFFMVFVGIESPSEASLAETKKYQNLREDPLASLRTLQRGGLWVMGGFIIGFDSDTEGIFDRQREFIERAAVPWAMAGFLQAPPTTPLFDRMVKEGRLLTESGATTNFHSPNFTTAMPRPVLLRRFRALLLDLFAPDAFYDRAFRSLVHWKPAEGQTPPQLSWIYQLGVGLRSVASQGLAPGYRKAYWSFVFRLLRRCGKDPLKLWWGFTLLCSGHHFIRYARQVADELQAELEQAERNGATAAPAQPPDNIVSRSAAGPRT